jgi:hypothetical protein
MSFLQTLGTFISEFARLILFFASLFLVLGGFVILVSSSTVRDYVTTSELSSWNLTLGICKWFGVYLIVLSLIGAAAAFFSSMSYIKLLAIMMGLNVVIGLTLLLTLSSNGLTKLDQDMEMKLEAYQKLYDWNHTNKTTDQVAIATKTWDVLQTELECCGYQSADDWKPFRPDGHKNEDIAPLTCCADPSKDNYCHANESNFRNRGCGMIITAAIRTVLILTILAIMYSAAICFLACLVLCCRPADQYSSF